MYTTLFTEYFKQTIINPAATCHFMGILIYHHGVLPLWWQLVHMNISHQHGGGTMISCCVYMVFFGFFSHNYLSFPVCFFTSQIAYSCELHCGTIVLIGSYDLCTHILLSCFTRTWNDMIKLVPAKDSWRIWAKLTGTNHNNMQTVCTILGKC